MIQTPDSKTAYQAELFANRLARQYRLLRKWARRSRISCYRLYDRDIPEVPLACDLYTFLPDYVQDKLEAARFLHEESAALSRNDAEAAVFASEARARTYAHLALYERPYDKPEEEEARWLDAMAEAAARTLSIDKSHVLIKTRKKFSGTESGRSAQYKKNRIAAPVTGLVCEQGQLFSVNLSGYLDTGLFLDHRLLRDAVRSEAAGKSVLNLFCYTGSFSVYAAEGRARRVESVDLSNTYLEWAERNMALNGFSADNAWVFTRADVVSFLAQKAAEKADNMTNRYDLIILDPPTFSNSKSSDTVLDINRDWPSLVARCLALLAPGGTLYFSTNSRRLSFRPELLPDGGAGLLVQDITARTIPQDFRNARIHRAWKITLPR